MRFYVLDEHPRGNSETCACEEDGYNQGDVAVCNSCGGTMGMLTWLPPYRATIRLYGKQFGDFAFICSGNYFLVSQRFRKMYHSLGLTGLLGFDLVEVVGVKPRRKQKGPVPAYFRVTPTRGSTTIDFAASGFEWVDPPTCQICKMGHIFRWRRLMMDNSTWSGHDVFVPLGITGVTIVSERFKDACEQNGITNASFTPSEDCAYDFYPWLNDPSEYEREPETGEGP